MRCVKWWHSFDKTVTSPIDQDSQQPMNTLEYRGFNGSVEFDADDGVLFGKLLLINDLVTYEGQSVDEIRQAFQEAVEDYIAQCQQAGKEPNKPLSGVFNVRVGVELHRQAALRAAHDRVKLNQVVVRALQSYLHDQPLVHNHVHRHEHDVKVTLTGPSYRLATTAGQDIQYVQFGSGHEQQHTH